DLKREVQRLCGYSRFRQRLLLPDGQILPDEAALNEPADVQLVFLPFSRSSGQQVEELWDAVERKDMHMMEELLQRPQDPDLEVGGRTPFVLRSFPWSHKSSPSVAGSVRRH
ncbi:ANKRD50, partial [Symbiodinium pilosum]